ncbi:hypothetical protein [Cohnella thailandensis]|jgi:hypothetical protein|uniref:Uncharacterized protein n=1 Tax=Cohnella thailandensis TaxID=557557 RepID=A0A841SW51_9BACL|nr:hypothetical protein [Cohnella thailandensis]MBB6636154.1 hypothetical protein [Cohnella thailandensis]MBP1973877.1 hypothetical protein [Cohnella thailandensis]
MLDAERLRADAEHYFARDLKLELTNLGERLELTDAQLSHIETLAQWAYHSGFHTGLSCGRQLSFNERLRLNVQ